LHYLEYGIANLQNAIHTDVCIIDIIAVSDISKQYFGLGLIFFIDKNELNVCDTSSLLKFCKKE